MPFSVLLRVVFTESSLTICVPLPKSICVERKHRISTCSAAMVLYTQPLPRPSYLQGVTFENYGDYATKCALTVFEHGRLSAAPCDLCVKNNAVCIVRQQSGRCMRCAYFDVKVVECQAEGVLPFTKPDILPPALPMTPGIQTVLARSDAQAARHSVFPAQNFITSNPPATSNPRGNTNPRKVVKQKRKRRVYDPTDVIEAKAKHLRKIIQAGAPTAIEHPYYPTAPTASTRPLVPLNEAVATPNTRTNTVRWIPKGCIDYDLRIRTEDPVAWARWAVDLRKEIYSLRHVQDLGPYTMGVIEMMKEDGVWPGE
ncbi:hypothetical protein BDR22DRAFT_524668 [Usnea florida]